MTVISNKKVFFYTTSHEGSPERAYFQDLIVNLAEGFQKLEVEFHASNNYWQLAPDSDRYLLQYHPDVQHHDCDVVVLERQWFEENKSLPKYLFEPGHRYITVYLDCSDGLRTSSWLPEFRDFDFIFKTHCNTNISYPMNVYPWAFGLSNRVLTELSKYVSYVNRNGCMLVNFRHVNYSHSLRRFIEKQFVNKLDTTLTIDSSADELSTPPPEPYHYLRWTQTGRRHYPNYYKRLSNSTACACFGGHFLAPSFTDRYEKLSYYLSRSIGELTAIGWKTNRIAQWDSWRLWESLAAGCTTFHVDFDKYGFQLPVMPKNWEHYIGIDLDNIQRDVDRIIDEPKILEKIATQGKIWALNNYSPQAVALRFMQTLFPDAVDRSGQLEFH